MVQVNWGTGANANKNAENQPYTYNEAEGMWYDSKGNPYDLTGKSFEDIPAGLKSSIGEYQFGQMGNMQADPTGSAQTYAAGWQYDPTSNTWLNPQGSAYDFGDQGYADLNPYLQESLQQQGLSSFQPTTGTDTTVDPNAPLVVTPGQTTANNQMNSIEYAGNIVGDPQQFFTTDNPDTPDVNESMFLSQRNDQMDPNAAGTNINGQDPKYNVDPSQFNVNAATAQGVNAQQASTYDAATSFGQVSQQDMQGAQGQLSDGSIIDPAQQVEIDTATIAAKGNAVGQAIAESAQQSIAKVMDASTAQAQGLDPSEYIDKKATVKGQLEALQSDFVDPATGEPKIPIWAQESARAVSKIAAFKGMTGSAATAAMATAIMEASIPIAKEDAKFFQTVTMENLNNRQETAINRANILAKMELTNADNRMAAAIQNSKNFLAMDLANLDNEQQARVINNQARIQSILEDTKAKNAARLFGAEATNDMAKFYDQLDASIQTFNATQINDVNTFNAEMETARQKFYQEMQYNIDLSNAKWRQTVTITEDQQSFEAAQLDVKNMVGISTEALNQVWDRSDALLDYLWKTSDNQLQRDHELVLAKLKAKSAAQVANIQADDGGGVWEALGGVAGTIFGGLF